MTTSSTRKKFSPSPYFLFLVFLWALVFFKSEAMGRIEGYFFPVITNFEFAITEKNNNYSVIYGSFEKIRNCSFESLEWKIKENDLTAPVEVSFNNQFVVRKEGVQYFTNWQLSNSSSNLDNSIVYARHICHPLWFTVTRMR